MATLDPFSVSGAQELARITGTQLVPQDGAISSDDLQRPSVTIPQVNMPRVPDISQIPLPAELQMQDSQTAQAQRQIQQQLLNTSQQMGQMPARQQELSGQFGIPEQSKRVMELSNMMRTLQMENAAIPLQIQEESAGRGRTFAGAQTMVDERQRRNAVSALGVSAMLQAEQGNLSLAHQQLESALRAEFAPLEAQLQTLQMAYSMNKDALEREDRIGARQLEFRIQERNRILEDRKEERRNVQNMMLEAFRYGASPEIAQNIGEAQTFEEALRIGGTFLGEPFRMQMEAAQFSQWLSMEQLDLQHRQFALQVAGFEQAQIAAEREMMQRMDEFSLKVGSEFTSDQRIRQYQIGAASYDRINQITGGRTEKDFERIQGNNAAERALVTQYIRMTQPDIARGAEAGDITATDQLKEKVESFMQGLGKDRATRIRKLKEVTFEADLLYQSFNNMRQSAISDFDSRLVTGVPLPNVEVSAPVHQTKNTGMSFDDWLKTANKLDVFGGNQTSTVTF